MRKDEFVKLLCRPPGLRRLFKTAMGQIQPLYYVLLAERIPMIRAQGENSDITCIDDHNKFINQWGLEFRVYDWITTGCCIRNRNQFECDTALADILKSLDSVSAATYNGAAGVLALLPTIGALLGAPTDEIWRLLTIVPFGGALAIMLSFGGATIPVRVDEYQSSINKKIRPNKGFSMRYRRKTDQNNQEAAASMAHDLLGKLDKRLRHSDFIQLPRRVIWLGLLGMVLLLLGSQVVIAIIEQGAILPWWCWCNWWMHLWYLLVTGAAIIENYVQSPFSEQYKLFLSNIPYETTIRGGDDAAKMIKIASDSQIEDRSTRVSTGQTFRDAFRKLGALQSGAVHINGRPKYAEPGNSVLVLISVLGGSGSVQRSFFRLVSKVFSIAVFVTGTAMFSSAQLLATQMGVLAVAPVMGAAVLGRAIASLIINSGSESEPMIHLIVDSPNHAHRIIAQVVAEIDKPRDTPRPIRATQIEIDGHIFVSGRRVAKRSILFVHILGIMAKPFDLLQLYKPTS